MISPTHAPSKLEVFREDIPRVQFQCQQTKLFAMRAHNYCILHRLNVCGMQCTSYYIGYLHSIKASWVIIQLKVYSCGSACHTPWWLSLFGDQLHRVTDRPNEVADWPQVHQACVGALELFDTIITHPISLTCDCVAVHKSSGCVASFPYINFFFPHTAIDWLTDWSSIEFSHILFFASMSLLYS